MRHRTSWLIVQAEYSTLHGPLYGKYEVTIEKLLCFEYSALCSAICAVEVREE